MHTKGPSVHDTEWRAMEMGSEGWAVFVGPRMIASHLSEANARLIAQAPAMLRRLESAARWVGKLAADNDTNHIGARAHQELEKINVLTSTARGE